MICDIAHAVASDWVDLSSSQNSISCLGKIWAPEYDIAGASKIGV